MLTEYGGLVQIGGWHLYCLYSLAYGIMHYKFLGEINGS